MSFVRALLLALVALALAGCASTRRVADPWMCAALGGVALGAGGAVVGSEGIDEGDDAVGGGVGGAVGAVVGAGLGYLICSLIPEAEPAPPPPPPAPAPPPPPPSAERIVLRGVNFAFDSDRIDPSSAVVLDVVAETLSGNPGVRVRIEGHTDALGSDTYNESLSERRAYSVLEYLVRAGISPGRMSAVGYGESRPVASNDTEEGRALNRRVELVTVN
jgi:OOP family OmpA-OmpF porin